MIKESEATSHFLTSPGSSVPSERVFSGAGFIVSAHRNRLGAETTEDVMFVYENIDILYESDDEEQNDEE